ncbi:MAG TPA: metallophosphoesterase [Thermomicrobiales bacterium]|nr:metallophosphoesterase [Thermomicrobiales bacterium]
MSGAGPDGAIPALVPRGAGHQFVLYADACSGVPGAPHEATFAAVNAVVARLRPQPEFVCFPGDEVIGLTADAAALRRQWDHWFGREMAWLDRAAVPLYHTTGNHTTYDAMSEAVYRAALAHLPRNGPPGQEGLSYFVRRGDLLLVGVNTCWSGLGEGRVETAWLDRTLADHADARWKLVMGHHPVWPVNGFAGPYQRDLAPEDGRALWSVLVRRGVLAYLCSHILAFDVQVHHGVLQLLTAGAGTAHRMPEETEYLHCVQASLDAGGLRYQVLDTAGRVREWLAWPSAAPAADSWTPLPPGEGAAPEFTGGDAAGVARLVAWRFAGVCPPAGDGAARTLLCGWDGGPALAPLWVGLLGPERRLGVLLGPAPGRSPHLWHGPALPPGEPFDLQVALHTGMGPGGVLWRRGDGAPWSSLAAASPWGAERLRWPARWAVGHAQQGPADRPFGGRDLRAWWHAAALTPE